MVASALNETPLDRLGTRDDNVARSPIEVMTGIAPLRDIHTVLPPTSLVTTTKDISHTKTLQVLDISKLQADLDHMLKDVSVCVIKEREQAISMHTCATNVATTSFVVGDFV